MTHGGSARLFVAIDPPVEVCERLAGWARCAIGVSGARLIAAKALHLTLCFLGQRELGEVDAVAKLGLGCAMPVCELEIGAPLWLPRRRPKVLAVQVRDGDGSLARLQSSITEELALGLGYEAEERHFRPHVTVARMRPGAVQPRELAPTPRLTFDAEALTLYRSRLAPTGATYEPLARVALS